MPFQLRSIECEVAADHVPHALLPANSHMHGLTLKTEVSAHLAAHAAIGHSIRPIYPPLGRAMPSMGSMHGPSAFPRSIA
jgi:hypothetical protein